MPAGTGPAVRRRRLMTELRRLRETASLSPEDVAGRLDWHPAKVARIEAGRAEARPGDVATMLGLYGVTDQDLLDGLVRLADDARQRGGWYSSWPGPPGPAAPFELSVGLEAEAATIRDFELAMMPPLLQTQDYARALVRGLAGVDPAALERRVELRLTRQRRLGAADPPQLWAILDEAAARRVVGGGAVMRAQLLHLAAAADGGPATVQVLPYGAGPHPGQAGSFTILGFAEPAEPELVYLETAGGNLYIDQAETVRGYAAAFDQLRAAALSPVQSQALLRALADELR